jgi:hypothetical protein
MGTALDMNRRAQRKALAGRFALGLLRPFSGMNISVRLWEIAHSILSRWPLRLQPAKPIADFCYLTMCDRAHWLMLRAAALCTGVGATICQCRNCGSAWRTVAPKLLRGMVQEALPHPKDSSCEQTIIATAVKFRGEFFPEKLADWFRAQTSQ